MLKQIAPLAAVLVLAGGIPSHAADAADTADAIQLQAKPPAPPSAPAAPQAPAAPADPLAAAPRISAADARKAVDAGKAVLVDVRAEEAFRGEHPKGSLNIPVNEIYARADELPKGKQIITYCT